MPITGGGRFQIQTSPLRTPEVGFLYHVNMEPTDVGPVLDDFVDLGFTTVAVSAIRYKTTSCAVNAYGWWGTMPGLLGTILTEATARHMKVYVGLVESSNVCGNFYDDPNKTHDIAEYTNVVSTVLASYGTSPALAGWYIINEQALPYEQNAPVLAAGAAYFLGVRNAIRALSSLPIFVVPYFGNYDGQGMGQTASSIAAKVATFRANTGGDLIINMQDSVGADAVNLNWWARTGEESIPTEQLYEALVAAVGRDAVWSDIEVFNYPSSLFIGGQYHPSSMRRFRAQAMASRMCGKRSVWLPTTHLCPSSDDAQPETANAKARYRAVFGLKGEMVVPVSYTWGTTPEAGRPDRGNALFDWLTGDPRVPTEQGWVGFASGGATVTVDMGRTLMINWVAVHTLENAAAGYRHPVSIKIESSPDGSAWTDQGTTTPGLVAADGEYMIGNAVAITASCRYLRVTLANAGAKTLLSEMEIVAYA